MSYGQDPKPKSAPHDCPGPESEEAGKTSACAGCPSAKFCMSRPKGPDPDVAAIAERLTSVRRKLLVLSGKGGVGKSTFSSQLALYLSNLKDVQVGLLDIDICGPSIPTILGLESHEIHNTNMGWEPAFYGDNLAVMSVGFLLPQGKRDDAVIWRGPKKNGLIKQFLRDVDWGELDFFVVDTPPGTSDEHISLAQYLKSTDVAGALIVTTPQEVALADVRKEISFCRKVGLPILGVVENMSGFVCPKCTKETAIFPTSISGGAEKLCKDLGVPLLGKIPLDPRLARACDQGKSFVHMFPDSIAAQSFRAVFRGITKAVDAGHMEEVDPTAAEEDW